MNRPQPVLERDKVRQAASDWIARRDAGLSAAEESEFQAWCNASSRHAEALARYEKLWTHLDRPRAAGAGAQVQRDLLLLQQRDRRRVRWAGKAALLLLVLGAGWWGLRPGVDTAPPPSAPLVVIVPERRVLADGTVVEYPAGAAIEVDFSSPAFRRVTLVRGEAHFQVAKNPARPFVVRAAGVDVQAVGTAFSVQLAGSAVEVVVTEGRVSVDHGGQSTVGASQPSASSSEANAAPSRQLVDRGQRISVALAPSASAPAPRAESLAPDEIEQRLAWRNPRMEFSNTSLHDVVVAINRYAAERGGVRFTLRDPAIGARRLSGIFRIDDASALVGILEKGFGIEAERVDGQTIELRAR